IAVVGDAEPGDLDLHAGRQQLLDHAGQVAAEELGLVDRDDVGQIALVRGQVEQLSGLGHHAGRFAATGVGQQLGVITTGVDGVGDDLDVHPSQATTYHLAQQLLRVASEHLAHDHKQAAGESGGPAHKVRDRSSSERYAYGND